MAGQWSGFGDKMKSRPGVLWKDGGCKIVFGVQLALIVVGVTLPVWYNKDSLRGGGGSSQMRMRNSALLLPFVVSFGIAIIFLVVEKFDKATISVYELKTHGADALATLIWTSIFCLITGSITYFGGKYLWFFLTNTDTKTGVGKHRIQRRGTFEKKIIDNGYKVKGFEDDMKTEREMRRIAKRYQNSVSSSSTGAESVKGKRTDKEDQQGVACVLLPLLLVFALLFVVRRRRVITRVPVADLGIGM